MTTPTDVTTDYRGPIVSLSESDAETMGDAVMPRIGVCLDDSFEGSDTHTGSHADVLDDQTQSYINRNGRFIVGGPTRLTGRKILVDTYGGITQHIGGVVSGKDPIKLDRSEGSDWYTEGLAYSLHAVENAMNVDSSACLTMPRAADLAAHVGNQLNATQHVTNPDVNLIPIDSSTIDLSGLDMMAGYAEMVASAAFTRAAFLMALDSLEDLGVSEKAQTKHRESSTSRGPVGHNSGSLAERLTSELRFFVNILLETLLHPLSTSVVDKDSGRLITRSNKAAN